MWISRAAAPGVIGLAIALCAGAADDPFNIRPLSAPSPRASIAAPSVPAPCAFNDTAQTKLALADVVERALCNNPQTRFAWSNAVALAEGVGMARAAFLPTLSGTISASRNRQEAGTTAAGARASGTTTYGELDAALSASYVLYDFGAREATLARALQTLAAANFAQDATLQKVFLAAVQAYYQLFAARAAVDSALEAERSALESLKAANARYEAGTATPADKYQAQTAYSQAMLNRIQAEGSTKSAEGALATAMGEDANRPLQLVPPATVVPDEAFDRKLDELIAAARRQRPDLAAAEAQLKAAQASVDAARAAGMPVITLQAGATYSDTNLSSPFRSQALGVSMSIPIFTGYASTYSVRAAQAQVQGQAAQRDSVNLQVALDVWQASYALTTNSQAVHTAGDLVASATQSERVALGRYKAGTGTILDLLTAQAALASARLQRIQAIYSWHTARAALAQAMGRLDLAAIQQPETRGSGK